MTKIICVMSAAVALLAYPGLAVPPLPNPLLFSPSGEVLGSLPYNFPDDPPAALRVTFAQWTNNFPQQIELYLTDPRAAGNRALPPLTWDPIQKKFVSRVRSKRFEVRQKRGD